MDNSNQTAMQISEDHVGKLAFSLWVIAFALLLTYWGDLDSLSNHNRTSTQQIIKIILGNIVIWFVNYDLADKLKTIFKSPDTDNPTLLFKLNVYAVIGMGIISVIDAFKLSDDNFIGIIAGLAALIILPCWTICQLLVAVKLIRSNASLLGMAIIAVAAFGIAFAVIGFETNYSKSNQSIFLILFGADFILNMGMYAAYQRYLNNRNRISNKSEL